MSLLIGRILEVFVQGQWLIVISWDLTRTERPKQAWDFTSNFLLDELSSFWSSHLKSNHWTIMHDVWLLCSRNVFDEWLNGIMFHVSHGFNLGGFQLSEILYIPNLAYPSSINLWSKLSWVFFAKLKMSISKLKCSLIKFCGCLSWLKCFFRLITSSFKWIASFCNLLPMWGVGIVNTSFSKWIRFF